MSNAVAEIDKLTRALRNVEAFGDVTRFSRPMDVMPMDQLLRAQLTREGYASLDCDEGRLYLTKLGRQKAYPSTEEKGKVLPLLLRDRKMSNKAVRER